LNGGTSLATSIGQHLLQKPDPGFADAGLAVRQPFQVWSGRRR